MQPSNQPSSSCTPLVWIGTHSAEGRELVLCVLLQFTSSCGPGNTFLKAILHLKRKHSILSVLPSSHHRLRCGWMFSLTSLNYLWIVIQEFMWTVELFCHHNMPFFLQSRSKKKVQRNKREVKFKQMSGFIAGRRTWVRLDMKCKKRLLANWNSINSLPLLAGLPWAVTVGHKANVFDCRSVTVSLTANTHLVWRHFSVDGSLTHTANSQCCTQQSSFPLRL